MKIRLFEVRRCIWTFHFPGQSADGSYSRFFPNERTFTGFERKRILSPKEKKTLQNFGFPSDIFSFFFLPFLFSFFFP